MRLVACSSCHTQYDVTNVASKTIPCRCGEVLDANPHRAVDAAIDRCGSCGASVGMDAANCDFCASPIVRDPDQLSLICPECYARSADTSRFCTACGVAFRPEPVRIEGHEFPCPVCTALMPPRRVAGIGTNECSSCHGLWVSGDGFDSLVSRAIEARAGASPAELHVLKPRATGSNPATQRVQYRKCPECDGFMQRTNYRKTSGVIIDSCRVHGTWLDADELEQIAGFILNGGSPGAKPHETAAERRKQAVVAKAIVENQPKYAPRYDARHDEPCVVDSIVGLLSAIFE